MFGHKVILGLIVGFFVAGWPGQAICQTQSSNQRLSPSEYVRTKQLEAEQRRKEFEKENKERWEQLRVEGQKRAEQQAKDNANGKNEYRNKRIKQTLELTDAQWKVIEPKINRVCFFKDQSAISLGISSGYVSDSHSAESGSRASGFGGGASSSDTGVRSAWQTQSSSSVGGMAAQGGGGASGGGIMTVSLNGPQWRYAERELTEGEKNCEELQTLLGDKNSKQEDIDEKIKILRRARENAAKELTKARQELCEVLTVRQQARLVLMGLLD